MTIASLAMYPFLHLRSHQERLWDGVRARLSFAAPELDWELDHLEVCRRDDLLLGQTCGWPLITDLASTVRVVGTFDCNVDEASDGTYRSMLVSNSDRPFTEIVHRPDLVVAANSDDSLSGWISLRAATAAEGVHLDAAEWTGAHAASIAALREGRAHVAAIDAVSWAHLGGGTGLHVVGHGPRILCLPLVTSGSSTDAVVDELRAALGAAVRDPALAESCAALKIRGFVELDLADYEGLSELAELW
jgi:ABC-type phosphate/phosphonate transport system substrate-binding protein